VALTDARLIVRGEGMGSGRLACVRVRPRALYRVAEERNDEHGNAGEQHLLSLSLSLSLSPESLSLSESLSLPRVSLSLSLSHTHTQSE
jgi:hypothetical protein